MLNHDQQGVRFRRQYGIGNYIVDFYSPRIHLVIEVDGDSHFQEGAEDKDRQRQKYLENLNLCVLRFTDQEILEGMEIVLEKIKETVLKCTKERGVSSNSP